MQLKPKALSSAVGTLLLLFALAIAASAQEAAGPEQRGVSIKNFGQMDERFYRGAQPKEQEFKELAAMGIRTVIDLRADPVDYEKSMVESLGMKYVNIPMVGKKYPTEEAVQLFLKVVNDPETGKFYVHCAGGRHRTGAMGAVYRYTKYNWTFEQVYAEMKKFDFYTSWGHGAFKDFVRDYYERMQASNVAPTVTAQASTVAVNTAAAKPTAPVSAAAPAAAPATASMTVDAIPVTDAVTRK
ncbi:MAG TPA: tyrosine-protein phosphatase [Pyrinomonadaceae bacterium]|nr:tyrosine-protein phosphatase [Pyrinomonadaceae bacterium]